MFSGEEWVSNYVQNNFDWLLMSICQSILPTAEIQFQIHREGWRIRMARGTEGPESHSSDFFVNFCRLQFSKKFRFKFFYSFATEKYTHTKVTT